MEQKVSLLGGSLV